MSEEATFVAACRAVADVLPRFSDMVRQSQPSARKAVGTWTLADVACHVSHVIEKDTDAIVGKPLPDVALSPAAVGVMTNAMLADDRERDVVALADRIDGLGASFLELERDPPTEDVPWIGGTPLPPSAVACHLLEELLVHGFDVARAAGSRWFINPAHAALAIAGGAVPIIGASPQSWVRPSYDPDVRARVEIRLRSHERFVLALDDGLQVELPPSGSRADAYLSAAPDALLLVMLGRRSHWHALLHGNVMVWGRRPTALFTLLANILPP